MKVLSKMTAAELRAECKAHRENFTHVEAFLELMEDILDRFEKIQFHAGEVVNGELKRR